MKNAHGMIILPWFHLEHGAPKCLEILECFRHGTVGSGYSLLPRNRRGAPSLYEPMHTGLDRIYPRIMRRRSNAPSHIRAHTNPGTAQREQCTFAPRRPTRTVPLLVRVLRPTKDVVRGFKREHRRGDVGLDKRNRTRTSQQSHKRTVVRHGLTRHRRVPHARIVTLDGEHVLEGHGHAGEWTGAVGPTRPSLGGLDHDLGETVGLGMRLQRAFGVCREDIGGV